MNSRERVLAVINHEVPDRIPTDIWATSEVWSKLKGIKELLTELGYNCP